jgi:recombination protein RecA
MSEDKEKALDVAINQIERQHGKGAIMRLGSEDARVTPPAISTGALNLDAATGIGGIPRGRVTEIYGPEASGKTTLCLHIIANAQKEGGVAAFIDAEHALDVDYARKLGVDTENLLVSQPDTGEQALEIAEVLVRSGALDAVVVDSVAALVPRAEIEGEMGDSHVGLQARLMSQAMRKLTGAIGRSDTALIFTNQIREKIGVMFGCFQYDTRVTLADGSSEKIGKIVNQKKDVEVLSYDPDTGEVAPRKVVGWYDNGTAETFLQFEVEGGSSGRRHFAATANHTVFTPDGPRPAGKLREGDEVLGLVDDYALTEDQEQVLLGGALGDGSLRRVGTHTASFRVGHGEEQKEYLEWKRWMLEPFSSGVGAMGNGEGFRTVAMATLGDLHDHLYSEDGSRRASAEALERLDARGLAVWYGDDGSYQGSYQKWGNGKAVIYNSSLTAVSRERVVDTCERLGVGRPRDDGRGFWFDAGQTRRLQELIAPYLHPSVAHKLHPDLRGGYAWDPDMSDAHLNGTRLAARRRRRTVPAKILRRYEKPKTRSMRRFDLEVEGNHTYMVDGVVVHNSPETTSGGRALKFYASLRLDIRRIASIKEGDEQVGNRTRVKVVKNKCAPPFKQAEFDIMFNEGISREGLLIDLGEEHGVVDRAGAWYSYGEDVRLGQGRENAKTFLKENPEIAEEIQSKIEAEMGISDGVGPEAEGEAAEEPEDDDEDDE